jgi:hypothetical protein
MPLMATGLLQHEAKLSVLNFSVKKAAAYEQPVANKDELLFVNGVRCALRVGHIQLTQQRCHIPGVSRH